MTTLVSTKLGVAGGGRPSVLVLGVMVLDFPMHEVLSCDDPHNPVVLVGCMRREERCGGESLCAGSSKAVGLSSAAAAACTDDQMAQAHETEELEGSGQCRGRSQRVRPAIDVCTPRVPR
jgi:bifunctional ADP-heptose synthase (sugar kinase/adenylyltransferase)